MTAQPHSDVVIVQRCVPHYRNSLFAALYSRYGCRVVASSYFPGDATLKVLEGDLPYVTRYPFHFPDSTNPYRCRVPIGRILRDLRPRAIVAEFSLSMSSSWRLAARRSLTPDPKVVYWSHGFNTRRGFDAKDLFFQGARVAMSMLADGHAVYSDAGATFLRRWLDERRIFVIRNSIEVPNLRAADRHETIARNGPLLVFVGRLTADKNVPGLVEAFREVARAVPGARLVIVGDGPDLQAVRRAAADCRPDSVDILGAIYEEERLAKIWKHADLAVFYGAVGLSVNHALAYGVPVVAFDSSSKGPRHSPEIEFVVERVTGVRVREYSKDAYVKAVVDLLQRSPGPKLVFRESIENYVSKYLSLDAMVRSFGEMLRRIAAL